jgi:predicted homoserine dehydrogenase-like protein
VEVVSSLARDGGPVARDLRWGVYVVFEAGSDYVSRSLGEYGVTTDESGRYAALYRPSHLIGLELPVSVLRAGLRGEATGAARAFRADVAATAKRDLAAGEELDGEGGYTVYGRLMPAAASARRRALPIGLAGGVRLVRAVAAGETVSLDDVELDGESPLLALRRELEPEPVAS